MSSWQTKKLGDVLDKIEGGGTPSKEKREYWHGSIPWASVKDLTNFNRLKTQDYITEEGLANSSSKLVQAGTLITPTRMALGFTVQFDVDVAINQDLKALYPNKSVHNSFLKYWFEANRKKIEKLGVGSTVAGIQVSELRAQKINLPEKAEQERIVGVLEVWDEYIEKLEQKIALKEQLKKGLMQQLLTAKLRLPGFTSEWMTVPLNKLGYARTSSVDKLSASGEQRVRLLNYMDVYRKDRISNTDDFQVVTAKDAQINTSDLKRGDVLFTPSSETPTDIGHSAVIVEDLPMTVFSYHLMRLRMSGGYLTVNFAAYCFKTKAFYKELWRRAQGATRFTLSKDALESAMITIPVDIEEQNAIANVIKTMDDEIWVEKSVLSEVKLQKKYLLKTLITGTIRTSETLKPKGVSS